MLHATAAGAFAILADPVVFSHGVSFAHSGSPSDSRVLNIRVSTLAPCPLWLVTTSHDAAMTHTNAKARRGVSHILNHSTFAAPVWRDLSLKTKYKNKDMKLVLRVHKTMAKGMGLVREERVLKFKDKDLTLVYKSKEKDIKLVLKEFSRSWPRATILLLRSESLRSRTRTFSSRTRIRAKT